VRRPSTVRPAESRSSPASAFCGKSGPDMLNLSLSAHDPLQTKTPSVEY
jgi:hypothetical protein